MGWQSIPQVIAMVLMLVSCADIRATEEKAKVTTEEYGTIYPDVVCGTDLDISSKKGVCNFTLNWSKSW
jgi:hypothetical protein